MRISQRYRRVLAATAAVVASCAVAAGCSASEPGKAAVVGDVTISEQQIADQMREVNELSGLPPTEPNLQFVAGLVNFSVTSELVNQAAEREEVTVPPAEVDAAYAEVVEANGGQEAVDQALVQSGFPPSALLGQIQTQLLAVALGGALAPGLPEQEQQQVLLAALAEFSEEIGVEVAPKYGEWYPEQLSIGPSQNPTSRIAQPQLPVNPLQQQQPQPQDQQPQQPQDQPQEQPQQPQEQPQQ